MLKVDNGLGVRLLDYVVTPQAVEDLKHYFSEGELFTGRWFERLAGGGDRAEIRNQITGDDIVAVSCLSVRIPAQVSIDLMENRRVRIRMLLEQIPCDVDLWDAPDALLAEGAPVWELWDLICACDGGSNVGHRWVTAGKLLARKRPRLVPVYDRVVQSLVALPRNHSWWLSLRNALTNPDLQNAIMLARTRAHVPPSISQLRVLDVILWMRGQFGVTDIRPAEFPATASILIST